jgi:hypothetical protein
LGGGVLTTAGSCALRRSVSIARVAGLSPDVRAGAEKSRRAAAPQFGHRLDVGAVPTAKRASKTPHCSHR